jgi:hypothetical protein
MKEIIELCVQTVYTHLHLSYNNDIFIDFTAGQGLFIGDVEKYLVNRLLVYDNAPWPCGGHPDIAFYDFLDPAFNFAKFDKTYLAGLWYDEVHVISMPPPDKIERCIEVASTFAQSISFLLPNKTTYTFPPNYKNIINKEFKEQNLVFQTWLKTDC